MSKFEFDYKGSKTYATEERAEAAVKKRGFDDLRYFLMPTKEGRWFPVFVDREAPHRGTHYHFHIT